MNRKQKLRRFLKNLSFTDYIIIAVAVVISPFIFIAMLALIVVQVVVILLFAQKVIIIFSENQGTWLSIKEIVTEYHIPKYATKLLTLGFVSEGLVMYRIREPFPNAALLDVMAASYLERNVLNPDTCEFYEFRIRRDVGKKKPRLSQLVPKFGSVLPA